MQSTSLAGCPILIVEDELIALDIRSAFEKAGAVVLTLSAQHLLELSSSRGKVADRERH